jgi:hypothetical protein
VYFFFKKKNSLDTRNMTQHIARIQAILSEMDLIPKNDRADVCDLLTTNQFDALRDFFTQTMCCVECDDVVVDKTKRHRVVIQGVPEVRCLSCRDWCDHCKVWYDDDADDNTDDHSDCGKIENINAEEALLTKKLADIQNRKRKLEQMKKKLKN